MERSMYAKSLVAAVIATVAASGAFAQFNGEATYEYPVATGSTTTRAQVRSEYFAARDAGQIAYGEAGYRFDQSQRGTAMARSRDEVKAEVRQANARGELTAFNGEATYERPQASGSTLTREQIARQRSQSTAQ
jgi:hypothetical protein